MAVIVCVVVAPGLNLAGFAPHADCANHDQRQDRDAADEHRRVELLGEHELELAAVVHQDRDGPKEADDEDGQQLLDEIVAGRFAVMMMVMSHEKPPFGRASSRQADVFFNRARRAHASTLANYPGMPVQWFIW